MLADSLQCKIRGHKDMCTCPTILNNERTSMEVTPCILTLMGDNFWTAWRNCSIFVLTMHQNMVITCTKVVVSSYSGLYDSMVWLKYCNVILPKTLKFSTLMGQNFLTFVLKIHQTMVITSKKVVVLSYSGFDTSSAWLSSVARIEFPWDSDAR